MMKKPKAIFPSIWTDSPCSHAYPNYFPPLEQSKRFHFNSIYSHDDYKMPLKDNDLIKKPELLLADFKRSIKDVDNALRRKLEINEHRESQKKNKMITKKSQEKSVTIKQKEVIQRLSPINQRRIKLEYDLYGNRSSFYLSETQMSKKKGIVRNHSRNQSCFSDGLRIDISRPQNFNPGPGTYFQICKNKKENLPQIPRNSVKENLIDKQNFENPHQLQNPCQNK